MGPYRGWRGMSVQEYIYAYDVVLEYYYCVDVAENSRGVVVVVVVGRPRTRSPRASPREQCLAWRGVLFNILKRSRYLYIHARAHIAGSRRNTTLLVCIICRILIAKRE